MDYVALLIRQVLLVVVDAASIILIPVVVVDVQSLKKKVSQEFYNLICKVKRGYRPDYEFILEEISFIDLLENGEIEDRLALTIFQYYLNNKWQIQS